MRSFSKASLYLVLMLASVMAFGTAITPTTTLTAERSNNTSTAATFKTSSNGNLGPNNVSKADHRTLMYPGSTTNMFVHLMMWWGSSSHINIGYNSSDPVQIQKQVTDMLSRGITGAIIDWYGPNNTLNNTATQNMYKHAASLANVPFKIAIMEDVGALNGCANTAGCDVSQQMVKDLTYVINNYASSPAYMRLDGRPVIMFFGVDKYSLRWDYIKANTPGNPLFIFQNAGGFYHAATSGSFAWVMINKSNPNDWMQGYLDDFYANAKAKPTLHAFGTAYKGFNDTAAAWSQNRIVNQNCGQTWLNTFKEIGKYYSSSNQLESMQIATWNDYEEGTSIETGIDNCVTVSATGSGSTLNWTITGSENTIDHYEVFASLDGQNLAKLANVAAGIRWLDISQFNLDSATYTFYVKAIGKPSMTNKMSGPVTMAINGANPGPSVTLNVTPTSGVAPVSVTATMTATVMNGSVSSTSINFGDGTVVAGRSASHSYNSAGTYTITASATDSNGKTNSKTATVSVTSNRAPVARLSVTPSSGTAPVTVTASTSGSSDPDGSITASRIDFGDGTVVNGTTASHTYSAAGTYTVTATVTDNRGATASSRATVTVSTPASFTGIKVASPTNGSSVKSPARFVAQGYAPSGRTFTTMRIYVDNVAAYSVNASTLDTSLNLATGSHYVVIQGWDSAGAVYKTAMNITVVANQAPTASLSLSFNSALTGMGINASLAGKDADGSVTGYRIDFGDGSVANSATATHAYSAAGTYTVRGTVTDNNGATATTTQTVTVKAPATGVTVLSPTGSTVGSPVRFVARMTPPTGRSVNAMRIYIDNVNSYTVNSANLDTYLNLAPGVRNVVIQAWDSAGAVYKTAVTISVR